VFDDGWMEVWKMDKLFFKSVRVIEKQSGGGGTGRAKLNRNWKGWTGGYLGELK
jgi:hypothetical protein